MLRPRPVALGLVLSLTMSAVAMAQQAAKLKVATTEPPAAAAPAVTAAPAPTEPIAIAVQQKLASPAKARRGDDAAEAADRAALAGYYATRIYAPLWVADAGLNGKAAAVIAELGKADDWGLAAADFPAPAVAAAPSADALAEAEIAMSLTALKYARYARG
jgi:murein L,D-transpeptidase YcbB/YkuD